MMTPKQATQSRTLEPVMPPFHKNFKDITGLRSGALVAIEVAGKKGDQYFWKCRCDCGEEVIVVRTSIARGATKSCGCLHKALMKEKLSKHGMTESPTYSSWQNMRKRCSKETNNRFYRYGGRGIKVCERWDSSFENFLADMGERPDGCSIERVDNNGNYEPGNCIWQSRSLQADNKCNSRKWPYKGRILSIAGWSRETGIGWDTLKNRVHLYGWTIEQAIETPTPKRRKEQRTI